MIKRMQYRAVLFCSVTLLLAGCNKQDDSTANYKTAINNYYKAHPKICGGCGSNVSQLKYDTVMGTL